MELKGVDREANRLAAVARGLLAGCYLLIGSAGGAVLGFWASDWGVRFIPGVVAICLALSAVAFALATAGARLLSGRFGRRARAALALAVAMLAALGLVAALDRPTPLTVMSESELVRAQELDARYYQDLDRTLRGLVGRFRAELAVSAGRPDDVLDEDDEALALDTWQSYLDAAMALDRIRSFHEDFYRFDLSRSERSRHVRSFLLSFASELSLYQNTGELLGLIGSRPSMERFLNLPRPERAIEADSVAFLDEELSGLTDLSRVSAGRRYLRYLEQVHEARAVALGERYESLWSDVDRYVAVVEQRSRRTALSASVSGDFAPILRGVKHLAFPVQREVAEWMGDTRLKRPGDYLVTREQARRAESELRPGDVLLARKNWYLSNIGLPGFWPHAILYVGTPDAIATAFDDEPDVLAWVFATTGRHISYTGYLATRFPVAWEEKMRASTDSDPLSLIEAVSEGVVQSALSHSSGDFLVALRPNLPPLVKAKAVARAFSYLNRPYDFDFDFATDDALVCTEVVWRAYRADSDGVGLRVDTVTVAGRPTLPANEIARLFVEERGRDEAQLRFVLYLQGDEELGIAVRESVEAFVTTATRSKWGG